MKSYNVCIVGGGSTYTLGFLKSFVRLREEFPLKKLVLFDIDAERQEPIGKYGEILFRERFPELDFSYTTDIKEAYEGMDFVFMQMRAGGLPMRAKDEHIPLSMGMIGQETCGAGGMAYGLRSCVDMIKAVHDIRNYAPDAWILNYSNPAAIVAEALRREFPDDKRIAANVREALKKETKSAPKQAEFSAPITGNVIPMEQVPDPAFSQKMMGDGFAIEPTEGVVQSPVDGIVEVVFPTGHAVGLRSDDGSEILIHLGIDTVELNGKGFEVSVKQGDRVKSGDVLVKVDLDYVKSAGKKTVSPVIFTSGEKITLLKKGMVSRGEKSVIRIEKA